jgi:3-methyladenine DNA glycosylase AlkD
MHPVIEQVRADLKANVDAKTQQTSQRFFKEAITSYGVKVPTVGKIAKKHWSNVKGLGKQEIFELCEQLFASSYIEEAFVVSEWLPHMVDRFELEDLPTFKSWIDRYVTNWAECDSFCNHTIGDFLEKFPQAVTEVQSWANSPCRWLKRAAAVSLILPARRGKFLKEVFEISDVLLVDEDDLVQKGYGWLLKEASRKHQTEVFNYVVQNRKVMPRTALRYAIELLPKELKAEAMKKA